MQQDPLIQFDRNVWAQVPSEYYHTENFQK